MMIVIDVSTYLLIAGIVTGDCKMKIILVLVLFMSTKGILNVFVTSVVMNV